MGYYEVSYRYKSPDVDRVLFSKDEYDSLEEALSRFLWLQHCGYEPVLRFILLSDDGEEE